MGPVDELPLASDPATPEDRLRRLAEHPLEQVRGAVARNPNTPADILLLLAGEFPADVRANPGFELHILADPARLKLLPRAALLGFARGKDTPGWLLSYLAGLDDEKVLFLVARSAATSPEVLAQLATCLNKKVRKLASENKKFPAETAALLERAGGREWLRHDPPSSPLQEPDRQALSRLGPWARCLLARSPDLPPWATEALARDPCAEVRKELASRAPLTEELAAALLQHGEQLASNPTVPPAIQRILASRANEWRFPEGLALASNPAATEETLASLCTANLEAVRTAAARHPRAPRALLDLLARAGSQPDLAALRPALSPGERPACSADELRSLARLGYWGACLAASHPSAPFDLLLSLLAEHPEHRVARLALDRLDLASIDLDPLLVGPRADMVLERLLARRPATGPRIERLLGERPPHLASALGKLDEMLRQEQARREQARLPARTYRWSRHHGH